LCPAPVLGGASRGAAQLAAAPAPRRAPPPSPPLRQGSLPEGVRALHTGDGAPPRAPSALGAPGRACFATAAWCPRAQSLVLPPPWGANAPPPTWRAGRPAVSRSPRRCPHAGPEDRRSEHPARAATDAARLARGLPHSARSLRPARRAGGAPLRPQAPAPRE